jgi:RNA polymerase sigma-70 factor (ECF subfamily)
VPACDSGRIRASLRSLGQNANDIPITSDAAAFDAVYAAYNRRLFAFVARLAGNRHVAEDLVEEAWLRLVRQARRLQADTRLAPWLFTVARNLYLSYCRSRMIEDVYRTDVEASWPVVRFRSPFEEAAITELERHLESAISRLPLIYREVLLLVAVEGLRPMEAATVCGVSPEAMRQRLSRARTLLAQHLEQSRSPGTVAAREVTS